MVQRNYNMKTENLSRHGSEYWDYGLKGCDTV
jgi:hypothetical protein